MTREDFLTIRSLSHSESLISSEDLLNKSDRTLLYGYTCERLSWHVYIKDNKIHCVAYGYNEDPVEKSITRNCFFVPDKRVYPECTDFEFAKLLFMNEVNVPYTCYEDRDLSKFYGKILD